MWNRIKEIMCTYAYVVLGVLIASATFISIYYPGSSFSVALLWQMLASSFVCALGNILWWTSKKLSRSEAAIRIILHYLYINVVVFGSALLFDWIDSDNSIMIVSMFMMILIIFIFVFVAIRRHDKRISEMMNRSLKKYQGQDE